MRSFITIMLSLILPTRRVVQSLTIVLPLKGKQGLSTAGRRSENTQRLSQAALRALSSSFEHDKENGERQRKKKKSKVEYDLDEESLAAAFASLDPKDGYTISEKDMIELRRLDEIELARLAQDSNSPHKNDFIEDDEGDYAIQFLDDDDDFLDFGSDENIKDKTLIETSMKERLEAAKNDAVSGRVSVSDELDKFARDASFEDLQEIGFKREENPFGRDETPRNPMSTLDMSPMECPACGANFQSRDVSKPGFLPPEKLQEQMKLARQLSKQKTQEAKKKSEEEWSVDEEIEWLLGNTNDVSMDNDDSGEEMIDTNSVITSEEDLPDGARKKRTICQRCHNLQNFGDIDETLRPGWTDEPLLSQERFRELLKPIREKDAVIIALVDLFDFNGSILPELDSIAGHNPVILAANKADLLPSKMGQLRVENWVRRELDFMGIKSLANIGGAVRLVSCKTGFGVSDMLKKVRDLADDRDCDVYIVGAANAGKSTLLNRMLQSSNDIDKQKKRRKKRAGNANANKGVITTSPLPGTTLKFIKVDLGNGRKMYDTPGLLVPGTLTTRLTPAELKMVVPKKPVEAVTFRVEPGKCVLVGGLARIEVSKESKPFMFTFFVSNDIKLHPTDVDKADDVLRRHVGEMITPPLSSEPERIDQIGKFEYHELEIDGAGWKEAAADISLRGLGWVSVTGAGTAIVRVGVPEGIGISVRPPLMPFDVWDATARYTGGKAVRKSGRSKTGKYKKGVGRR